MFEKFLIAFTNLQSGIKNLPQPPRFLLALSGGLDSCVMAHLFHKAGYSCSVAHCNFMLRGEESNGDEQFVKQLASKYEFDFYVKHFDTETYASDNHISVQMAARNLRYDWFNELIKTHNLSAVAVAHHADDVVETMLINLVRGAGLAGMHGIGSIHGNVIRPLLFASGKELENYAKKEQLSWREDSSNSEDFYTRNKIRLHVIPQLREINPSFTDVMLKHARLMSSYENLLNNLIEKASSTLVKKSQKGIVHSIQLDQLLDYPEPEVVLYHIISKFGFNGAICKEVLDSRRTGAEFFARGFKMIAGREALYIFNTDELFPEEEILMYDNEAAVDLRFGTLEMQKTSVHAIDFDINHESNNFTNKNFAFLDGDLLTFPLKVRRWKSGDFFHPLGMKGRKLISDFFVDEKFTPEQKELVYLLQSGQDIIWVIGHRIDERYKLKTQTGNIRKFTWKQNE